MTGSQVATVEVPFEALVKELGTKRAIEFISEIRRKYGNSVVELRKATEKLTIGQIEREIKQVRREERT
jgi:hypothetical protein